MAYTKKVWKDAPDTSTPINAANLNHMEDGIAEADVNAQNALDRLDDVDDEITQINSDLTELRLAIKTRTQTYSITSTSQTAGYYYQNLGIPSEIGSTNKIYSCMLVTNTGVGTVVSIGVDTDSNYVNVRYTQAPNNGSITLRFLYNGN